MSTTLISEARIDRKEPPDVQWDCRWCWRPHGPWEPHRDEPPGRRYDPTLRYRSPEEPGPIIGKRWKVNTAELVDPSYDHFGVSNRVLALAWMAREASRKDFRAAWGAPTVTDLIRNKATCVNGTEPLCLTGCDWRDRTSRSIRNAILCRSAGAAGRKWREALGLAYGSDVWIPGPVARYEGYPNRKGRPAVDSIAGELDALLTFKGWLAWSLNTCHPKAVRIWEVRLKLGSRAWVEVNYSYPDDPASWTETLAEQLPDEPLLTTLRRAGAYLGQLVDPLADPPMVERWAAHGGKPAEPAPWVTEDCDPSVVCREFDMEAAS